MNACKQMNDAHGNNCTRALRQPVFDLDYHNPQQTYSPCFNLMAWATVLCPRKLHVSGCAAMWAKDETKTVLVDELCVGDFQCVAFGQLLADVFKHVKVARRFSVRVGCLGMLQTEGLPDLVEEHGIADLSVTLNQTTTDETWTELAKAVKCLSAALKRVLLGVTVRHMALLITHPIPSMWAFGLQDATHLQSLELKNVAWNVYASLAVLLKNPGCSITKLSMSATSSTRSARWADTGYTALRALLFNCSVREVSFDFLDMPYDDVLPTLTALLVGGFCPLTSATFLCWGGPITGPDVWKSFVVDALRTNRCLQKLIFGQPGDGLVWSRKQVEQVRASIQQNRALLVVRLDDNDQQLAAPLRVNRVYRQNWAAVAIDKAFQRANADSLLVKCLPAVLMSQILPLDEFFVPYKRKSAPPPNKRKALE